MPRTNNIKLRYGPASSYNGFPSTYPMEKKHYYGSPFFSASISPTSSLTLYGSYIKIQLSTTSVTNAPLVAGDYISVNGYGVTLGLVDSYEVVSFDQVDNFIIVSNSAVYALLVGGADGNLVLGTVTAYNYFINNLTGITASSGTVRFDLSSTSLGTYTQGPLKHGPAIGDTVTTVGVLATPNTFNFNTYYKVTYVDKVNNYFLATNVSAYAALTSGVVADITTQTVEIYVCRLTEGELAYESDTNEFIHNKLFTDTYFTGINRSNTKSGPIKFVPGLYYYPPCNQGNLSVTLTKNIQYFIPFVVPNKTTFSTATLSTKTNTSTNIQFGIFSSYLDGTVGFALAVGGGTSAVTWNLDSAAVGMTSPYGDGYHGSYRKTTGIELNKGLYYLAVLDAGATGAIAVNAGVGIGIVKDPSLSVFNPVGSFLETAAKAVPIIDGVYGALTTTLAVPYIAMRSV